MGSLGIPELLLIFLVVLLVFGAKRIPEIARGLGRGIKEFKSATSEISRELNIHDQPQVQSPRPPAHGAPTPRGEHHAAPAEPAAPPADPAHRPEVSGAPREARRDA